MHRGVAKKSINLLIFGLILLFISTGQLQSEINAKGNVLGYIYGPDGTTPYEGAVMKVVNVTTGAVYESTVSNSNGVLKLSGLETGFYEYAVTTKEGTFVSESNFGLIVGDSETEKMAISVNSVSKMAVAEPAGFPEPEEISSEPYVGRVIGVDLEEKKLLWTGYARHQSIHGGMIYYGTGGGDAGLRERRLGVCDPKTGKERLLYSEVVWKAGNLPREEKPRHVQ